jgi:putative oxidoreductase
MIRNKYIILVLRIIVGGVFLWAGVLKIFNPLEFAQGIANYRVSPRLISFFLALVLPWLEVLCGVFLIFGIFRKASAFLVSCLLVGFLVLVFSAILRGLDIDCGCFGSLSQKADYKLILTDSLLLFFSLNILFSRKTVRT